MIRKNGSLSIRWKIVLIYCILVFIAVAIIGVFIISQIEAYYINTVRTDMTNIAEQGTLVSLGEYEELAESVAEIQANIGKWVSSIDAEMFVIDEGFHIIASNTANVGKTSVDILDQSLILTAISGQTAETEGYVASAGTNIPVLSIAFPITGPEGVVTGVLYMRANLSSVYDSVAQSRNIFLEAMLIALFVTIILGILISKSITGPINDVAEKAARMAEGDFSQEIAVRSDDEIGRMATMFNLLRMKLDETISEMSTEKTKLETILKYMEDGLLAVDLKGVIIHANPAAEEILHDTGSTVAGKDCDDVLSQLRGDLRFSTILEKCKDGPVAENFSSGGSSYALRYTRFRDDTGSDVGVILILQDITERQKLEKMQMDFVANVSHELKTPLTTIKSYTETLMDGAVEEAETAQSFLQIIDEEANRMNRLVRDLLQLSRLDYRQEAFNKQELNLIAIIRSAVTKTALAAEQKKQHLNCFFDAEASIRIMADKDGMEQVMLNIISNAIKYTKNGGRIDVDAFASGKTARVIVSDNGIGIPESMVSRVFERFFRADKARSRAMGGTGLGLAITKQIVEEHGGSIELESRENIGTKVTVELPLAVTRGFAGIE